MKALVLCCTLLASSFAFGADAGLDGGRDAGSDGGAVVKMSEVVIVGEIGNVEVRYVGLSDAGITIDADGGISGFVVPSLDKPMASARGFYDAVRTGNGWLAAMFMLFFLVGALRIVGKRLHKMIPDDTKHWFLAPVEAILAFIFDTKVGGWLLNWASAVGGCLSSAALAGMPVDASSWKVAVLASTGGTALIELKDDVVEWWDARMAKKAEATALAAAKAAAAAAAPPTPLTAVPSSEAPTPPIGTKPS